VTYHEFFALGSKIEKELNNTPEHHEDTPGLQVELAEWKHVFKKLPKSTADVFYSTRILRANDENIVENPFSDDSDSSEDEESDEQYLTRVNKENEIAEAKAKSK
jgi:hypothetical protein